MILKASPPEDGMVNYTRGSIDDAMFDPFRVACRANGVMDRNSVGTCPEGNWKRFSDELRGIGFTVLDQIRVFRKETEDALAGADIQAAGENQRLTEGFLEAAEWRRGIFAKKEYSQEERDRNAELIEITKRKMGR